MKQAGNKDHPGTVSDKNISLSFSVQRTLASEEAFLSMRKEGRNGLSGNYWNIQARGIFKIRILAEGIGGF